MASFQPSCQFGFRLKRSNPSVNRIRNSRWGKVDVYSMRVLSQHVGSFRCQRNEVDVKREAKACGFKRIYSSLGEDAEVGGHDGTYIACCRFGLVLAWCMNRSRVE